MGSSWVFRRSFTDGAIVQLPAKWGECLALIVFVKTSHTRLTQSRAFEECLHTRSSQHKDGQDAEWQAQRRVHTFDGSRDQAKDVVPVLVEVAACQELENRHAPEYKYPHQANAASEQT